MAKVSQTFKKRQRENKVRERAQMKREHRQQRAMERKLSKAAAQADSPPARPAGDRAGLVLRPGRRIEHLDSLPRTLNPRHAH